jgi:hypothetical protein
MAGTQHIGTVIVLLNWNGAQDTIECMESLLRMEEQDFLLVVCDNASTDGSFEQLIRWGEIALPSRFATWGCFEPPPQNTKMVLIQTGANLGFAGGSNVGLRYALLHTDAKYVWLLNNDTVADAHALGLQIAAMQQRPDIGILGSTLVFFHEPDRIQAPAGYGFNFWTGRVHPIGSNLSLERLPSERVVEARLKFVSGASMFVRRNFLETVGLLNEQYFLYFEEIDWAIRRGDRFQLGYCAASRIWHKEGRSIGSHRELAQRSLYSEGLLARNRVLFIKTYFPWRLPICMAWILLIGIVRALKGQWKLTWTLWSGALRGLGAASTPIPAVADWPKPMHEIHLAHLAK